MPDYYDVCELRVESDAPLVPIVWQELPNLVWTDTEDRQIRSRNYVNEPRSDTRFQLASGYTLPEGWTYRGGGRLNYQAILGQTVRLKFTATRDGVPNVDSNEFTIRHQGGFTVALEPSREYTDLAYDQTAGTIWLLNHYESARTYVYLNNFNVDGSEIVANAFRPFTIANASGLAWANGTLYATQVVSGETGGTVYAATPGGTTTSWTFTGGKIVGLAYDGTYLWMLDSQANAIRAFTLTGTEQTSEQISVPWEFADAGSGNVRYVYRGFAYGNDLFWIAYPETSQIRVMNRSGAWAAGRDITAATNAILGIAYDNANDILWYQLYDVSVNPNSATFYAQYVGD